MDSKDITLLLSLVEGALTETSDMEMCVGTMRIVARLNAAAHLLRAAEDRHLVPLRIVNRVSARPSRS